MPRSFTVPSHSYTAGTRNVEIAVDDTDTLAQAAFTREAWPAGQNAVDVKIFYSNDNGANFRLLAGATAHGGVLVNRNGVTVTTFTVSSQLPDVGSNNRRIQAELTNTVTLTTAITASVS